MTVNIDDDCECNSRLGRAYTDGEEREEHPLIPIRKEQAVECCEIDIHTVEDQLYGDKHCNKVATGHEPEDSDEEQQSAKDKEISYWYHLLSSFFLLFKITRPPIMQARRNTEMNSNGST